MAHTFPGQCFFKDFAWRKLMRTIPDVLTVTIFLLICISCAVGGEVALQPLSREEVTVLAASEQANAEVLSKISAGADSSDYEYYCSNCGATVAETATNCPNCGSAFDESLEEASSSSSSPGEGSAIAWVAAGLALALGIGALVGTLLVL
jgi:rRNA maturation endonuclease Nob1